MSNCVCLICDVIKLNDVISYCFDFIASDERDPVVSYWCRLYGLQTGLKLSTKQPEETALLIGKIIRRLEVIHIKMPCLVYVCDFFRIIFFFSIGIMDWLEKCKKEHHDNEAITNDVVAQAYLENYALKLFSYADQQDRAAVFNK